MLRLISSASDYRGSGPGFESGMENSEDRQSHCVYCKISGQRGKPLLEAKKIERKNKLDQKELCSVHPVQQ